MSKLKELICYFLTFAPHALNKTEIVKMIYMFEYYHVQTYGMQYSDVKFVRWDYGPFARVIENDLENFIACGLVDREIIYRFDGGKSYLHSPRNTDIVNRFSLDVNKRYIANRVILELSNKLYDDMIEIVYSTPPMEKILQKEREKGSKLYGRELEMKECKPIKRFSKENIEAARKRLDKSSRGTDDDYYGQILRETKEFELVRRRANTCLEQ